MADDLRSRIDQILLEAQREREARRLGRRQEMEVLETRLRRAQGQIRAWMGEIVIPRLRALCDAVPSAGAPAWDGAGGRASVTVYRGGDLPVDAEIAVSITPDPDVARLIASFQVSIVPILADFSRHGRITLDAERSDAAALERFLDESLLQFAQDYVRIMRPDSPYQRDRLVTDPVCGMTFPVSEAGATLDAGGVTRYFCVEECRRKFQAEPARYGK